MIRTSLHRLPLELILGIAEFLDVISLIRLSWASRDLHALIGKSRSFRLRYCRVLLQDEQLPAACFDINSLSLLELLRLATRQERIARTVHPNHQQNLLPAQRAAFKLDHDPSFFLGISTIRLAPGGRWVILLASGKGDDTVHLMCWDTTIAGGNGMSQLPVASIQIEADPHSIVTRDLSSIHYDPSSKVFYFYVKTGVNEDPDPLSTRIGPLSSNYAWRVTMIEMESLNNQPPSFRVVNRWAGLSPPIRFLGRWVGTEHDQGNLRESIFWDSLSGELTKCVTKIEQLGDHNFERIASTRGGLVLRIHGEINADRLQLSIYPYSVTPTLAPPKVLFVPGTQLPNLPGTRRYQPPTINNFGSIRLSQYETATVLYLKCFANGHRFSTIIAASDSGSFQLLPRFEENWLYNEHLVPVWSTWYQCFSLFTASQFQKLSSFQVTDAPIVLGFIPGSLHDYMEEQRPLLALPSQNDDTTIHMRQWECKGVCFRSGVWIFHRTILGEKWDVMVVRCD
ncbi:hypothetical protein DL93DRAFT_2173967 [Clavulina sp. PMI_390]|nr:hypothetical protein DL93DRAFT_2173967 [Clavulina sp. PMI_390]